MNKKQIDLHVHSTFSDGTFSPAQLVDLALAYNLSAFALTDHDIYDGVALAQKAAEGTGLEVIPGIEFSTIYKGKDVHIVGIDLDLESPLLTSHMAEYQASRIERNKKIIRKMQKDGIDISLSRMKEAFGDHMLTRAHFARYLADHGYAATMKEAFQKYLGEGCLYYIPRENITPHEVVRLIHASGGIPILAHPMLITLPKEELQILIETLIPEGLIGIEAIYSTYTSEEEAYVRSLADRYRLMLSGGSDFHGSNKPRLKLGSGYDEHPISVPMEILDNLRNARRQ